MPPLVAAAARVGATVVAATAIPTLSGIVVAMATARARRLEGFTASSWRFDRFRGAGLPAGPLARASIGIAQDGWRAESDRVRWARRDIAADRAGGPRCG